VTQRSSATHAALEAEQRRMALLALAACVWLLGAALIGVTDAFGYLAPTLALFALLLLGRYPGEDAYQRRLGRPRRAVRLRPALLRLRPLTRSRLPRGGALIGAGLAGRAPPRLAG
jgi:hypothetical protein